MAGNYGYIRQDQADIRVHVDGTRYGGDYSWVTLTGGKVTAAGAKTRPGGMSQEIELGGPASRSDAVVTTQMSDIIAGTHKTLQHKIGRGRVTITVKFLDSVGNALSGQPETIKGVLKGAEIPDLDGEATGAVGMYTLTVGCDELNA